MKQNYETMSNSELHEAARQIVVGLEEHWKQLTEDPASFPEFQKLYGETYGPHASEIIRAANRRAGSGVDASVSGNLLNRAHLEKIIDALHQTMKLPDDAEAAKA